MAAKLQPLCLNSRWWAKVKRVHASFPPFKEFFWSFYLQIYWLLVRLGNFLLLGHSATLNKTEVLLLKKKGDVFGEWQLAASAPASKGKRASWVRGDKVGPEIRRYALTFISPWTRGSPSSSLSFNPKQMVVGESSDMPWKDFINQKHQTRCCHCYTNAKCGWLLAAERKAGEPRGRRTAFAETNRKRTEMQLLLDLCMRNTPQAGVCSPGPWVL